MTPTWDLGPGVVVLPSGRRVRGRARRSPDDGLADFVLLLGRPAAREAGPSPRPSRRIRPVAWPDFWLPTDRADARDAFEEAHNLAATARVEVCCRGGRGRTGTALAVLATINGLSPADAIRFVRDNYHPGAVETPWQKRYVATWRH